MPPSRASLWCGLTIAAAALIALAVTGCVTAKENGVPPAVNDAVSPIRETLAGMTVVFDAGVPDAAFPLWRKTIAQSVTLLPTHLRIPVLSMTLTITPRSQRCGRYAAGCTNPEEGWIEMDARYVMPYPLIHEFGHVVGIQRDANGSQNYARYLYTVFREEPSGPTDYGETFFYEDFAESFALYVLQPDALDSYPLRYSFFRELFGIEYR